VFELFIAHRYLRAKRKQAVISVISVISVMGVAAGVFALVVTIAITNGFRSALERDFLAATAPVTIQEKQQIEGIENWEALSQKLRKLPHVTSAEPGLYEPGELNGPVNNDGVLVKGIPIGPGIPVPGTLQHLKSGSINNPGIILGAKLAEKIGAVVGKPVTLIVPTGELTPAGPVPAFRRVPVAGTFESGFSEFDTAWAFMSLQETQKAFSLSDVVNSIEIQIDNIYNADEVANAARSLIGPALEAVTWRQQNGEIWNSLQMERWVAIITISLIELVAALNILITLIMMVMEKHRDIAILMSMGARAAQIRRIFVLEGALIGAVGTALGLTLGYTACYVAGHYRLLKLPDQVYPLAFVPFESRWTDGVWIAAAAMAISLIATIYPARNATRIAPVEALRYE
jgi:lipoprotein-releasing system permease protein